MALNEHNAKRQYTRYKKHVNESHERVDAKTVNELQSDLNIQQQETNVIKDTAFEERIYTIFNNNLYANAMFVDCFKTGEYVDMNKSSNVILDYPKTQLNIDKALNGTGISTVIYSTYGVEVEVNDFFLITNDYIPVGAEIKYYLETSTGERWPILPNSLKLPLHLTKNLKFGFRIIIDMKANALGESPLLNGYAVLYWDAEVERSYGFTNPDLRRFDDIEIGDPSNSSDGMTIIVRDRAQDDKVVKVIEPLSTVNLLYDENNDGRLSVVETHIPDYYNGESAVQIHELYYEDYLNSNNEIENVLQKVKQTTNVNTEGGNTT